jgi:small subunit ribosomal protein S17
MADETEETTDEATVPDAAPATPGASTDDVAADAPVETAPEPAEAAEAAVAPAAPAAAAPTPAPKAATPAVEDGERPNRRKVREGVVVSDAMQSTVVVAVVERVRHPRYGKTVQRTKKLYVHDAEDTAKVGDRVRVQETRPLSKLKRWRLTEVLERAR